MTSIKLRCAAGIKYSSSIIYGLLWYGNTDLFSNIHALKSV